MKQDLQTTNKTNVFILRTFLLLMILMFSYSNQLWSQLVGDFRTASTGNWNNPITWERFTGNVWEASGIGANNPGQIPSITSSVFITSAGAVTLTSVASCNDITIDAGSGVVAASFTLSVNGNWTNNGSFVAGASTVSLTGVDQIIGGTITTTFNHLMIGTTNTLELDVNMNVIGNMTTTVGNFKTHNFDITVNGLTTLDGLSSIKDDGGGNKQYNGGLNITGGAFFATTPITIPSTGVFNMSAGSLKVNNGAGTFTVASGASINITGGSIQINADQTFVANADINMSGTGTITGAGAAQVNANINMNGGSLNGSGSTIVTNPFAINLTGATVTLSRNISTGNLNWISGNATIGSGTIVSATTMTVNSIGTIGGNGSITVSGFGSSFSKPTTSTATINAIFNLSSPAIANINGNLVLGGGGSISSFTTLNNGSLLQFVLGTFTINSPGTLSGAGNITVSGATVSSNVVIGIDGSSSITVSSGTLTLAFPNVLQPNVLLSGGVLNINAATTFANLLNITGGVMNTVAPVSFNTPSSFNLTTGNININAGSSTFTVPASIITNINSGTINITTGQTLSLGGINTMTLGTISGAGSLVVSSPFLMNGGTMSGTGTSTFTSLATLTIGGNISIGRTTNLNAGVNWNTGNISLTASAAVNIGNGSLATFNSIGTISTGGSINVNGIGTSLIKTSTGTTTINSAFNLSNPSTLSISGGTLFLGAGGTITGSTTLSNNTTIQLNGGTFNFNTPSLLSGNGNLIVSGATVNANIPIGLNATSAITVTSGTLLLGAASTLAPTITIGGGTFAVNSNTSFSKLVTLNGGTMNTIAPVTLLSTSGLLVQGGTLNINAGTGIFTIPSELTTTISSGTIAISASQTLNLAGPTMMTGGTINGNGTLNEGALFSMNGGTLSGVGSTNIVSPGSMSIAGNVAISKPLTTPSLNWTAGNINLGSLLTISGAMNVSSLGVSSGSGTISAASLTKTTVATSTINNVLNISNNVSIESGILVFGANSAIAGNLNIVLNAKARLSNGRIINVQSLTLAGSGAIAGSWGSNSSAATNKNDTYFDLGTTGIVQVSLNTCITPVASISTSANTLTCLVNSITLTGSGTGFYFWENGSLNAIRTITLPGTYTLIISSNGCGVSTASVTIDENTSVPTVTVSSGATTVCQGVSTTLNASGVNNYLWVPGNLNGSDVVVTPLSSTTYTVIGTNTSNGCTNSSMISISVNPLPVLNAFASLLSICNGNSTTISTTGADVYQWMPGEINNNSFIASPNNTTNYTVTGTNSITSCSNTTSITIVVNPLPNIVSVATASAICNGASTSISASGANAYHWEPGNINTNSSITVTPLVSTTYTVTGTNTLGCSNTATRTISVNNCNVIFNIKIYIEGYYDGGGLMKPVQLNQGVGISNTNVDFITLELHSANAPHTLVSSSIIVLHTDGTASASFSNVLPDSYYLVIKHRNAIETWSASAISTVNGIVNYDFSNAANKTFGNNMKEVETGVWAFYSGDINSDDNIDLLDLTFLEFDINDFAFGNLATDLNGDGNVDLLDNSLLESNVNNFIFTIHP